MERGRDVVIVMFLCPSFRACSAFCSASSWVSQMLYGALSGAEAVETCHHVPLGYFAGLFFMVVILSCLVSLNYYPRYVICQIKISTLMNLSVVTHDQVSLAKRFGQFVEPFA